MNAAVIFATFVAFMARWSGRGADFDHAYGFQCMDVAEFWAQALGKGRLGGNAIDLLSGRKGWAFVKNTPNNFPPRGALVIFQYSPYGHVAVAGAANVNSMNLFQQNNPLGSLCHFSRNVSYAHCAGWLVPL